MIVRSTLCSVFAQRSPSLLRSISRDRYLRPSLLRSLSLPLSGRFSAPCRKRLPTLLALAITISATAIVIAIVAFLVIWGFGVVGQWLFGNTARFQELYLETVTWLDLHGIHAGALISEYFDVNWMLRAFQQLTGRAHGLVTFVITTLIFLLLGLLEVDVARRKLENLDNKELGRALVAAFTEMASSSEGTWWSGPG